MSIRCIQHTHEDHKRETWCGRPASSMEWFFTSVDHALHTIASGSAIGVCPACVMAVQEMLGHADDEVVESWPLSQNRPAQLAGKESAK